MGNTNVPFPQQVLTNTNLGGNTVTFSTAIDPSFERGNGRTALTITAVRQTLSFSFLGKDNQLFTVVYDTDLMEYTTTSNDAIIIDTPRVIPGSGTIMYTIIFFIVQRAEYTLDALGEYWWTMSIARLTNGTYAISGAFVESHPARTINAVLPPAENQVRITVSSLPMTDFQEAASVTFLITNDTRHGCACGEFKQLIGEYNKNTRSQEIHVLNPFLYCYLAGKGEFTVDKLFSINKQNILVWPQVLLYAMVKFILHRLITSCFDMDIVYRKNTKRFLEELRKSKYSNFLTYFEQNFDNEKYFLYGK